MSSFLGSRVSMQTLSAKSSRQTMQVRNAVKAEPASVPVKKLDASAAGEFKLQLHVAPQDTANHVVHRYMVMFRQNNRAVSSSNWLCIQ